MNDFEKLLFLGYKYADVQLKAFERQILSVYKEAWEETRKELLVLYKNGTVTLSDMQKYNRLKNLERDLRELYRHYAQASKKVQIDSFTAMIDAGHHATAFAIEAFNPQPIRFGMVDPAVVEAALANPYSGLTLVQTLNKNDEAAFTRIWRALVTGMARGLPYHETANSVKDAFEKSSVSSAMRVLRTEGHRAQVIGQDYAVDQAEEAGVQGKRYWIATLDDRTRDTHAAMDGVEENEDGMFVLPSGVETEAPGLSGVPEEDINCRCRVGYRIDGLEPELRRARNPVTGKTEVITYQTYRDYFGQFGEEGRKQYVARITED